MKETLKDDWPEPVKAWLERTIYDFETARAMHKTGRYLYVVFMCQQAIEKAFKAMLTLQNKEVKPIHNLSRLALLTDVLHDIDEESRVFIDSLSAYYLNARYKETISALSKTIGRKESRTYLRKSKELISWLIQKMRLSL